VKISMEELVAAVVREVVAELTKRGVEVVGSSPSPRTAASPSFVSPAPGASVEIDMSGFKTPVLTESQLTRLGPGVGTVVVPCRTVVTPGAWDLLRSKKLNLVRKVQPQR
jgi:hypothetical protein